MTINPKTSASKHIFISIGPSILSFHVIWKKPAVGPHLRDACSSLMPALKLEARGWIHEPL